MGSSLVKPVGLQTDSPAGQFVRKPISGKM
jgi:hypothetical protein